MKKLSLNQLNAIYCVYKDLNPRTRIIRCCTCGTPITINSYEDAYQLYGHFIPRSIKPNLINHPDNSHAQCPNCNVYSDNSSIINTNYDRYMIYRYGEGIKERLLAINDVPDKDYYINYYFNKILVLSTIFPELSEIVVESSTGEVRDSFAITQTNAIELQFDTFSKTYKADLDTICKAIGAEYVEYEKL